ncbi:pleckstrin homology domain-containing family A member 5 isoform X6 [Oncorhynchus kisutch]|uniref:pleckstrin homology domain-containing family A member 5 isoform X6 n=1 Tax=Oncorhynchus kisutch TaxID=8019 RepID=UPI0012DD5DBC|nr:pleckstrin homology domain-containing family A member 5 isoform X6 [Oncorhynchus kisutch]
MFCCSVPHLDKGLEDSSSLIDYPLTEDIIAPPVWIFCGSFSLSSPKAPANEKKECPMSTMSSEASNYTGGSDYATHPSSPAARPSRSSKKMHNFGKRFNLIRRNPNAAEIKSNWLYKQDSTGMKLWKKRWFVLSDMCLYYYRDEKEEGILGSILLPSFHISMLSVDDHINRKYAFKATHPNMRTYYFCTDAAKDMESWMKVMTDAALVHSEPIKSRLIKVEQCRPQDFSNHITQNHRPVLTRPVIQNNKRNQAETEQEQELYTVAAITTVTSNEEKGNRKQCDAERYGFQKEGAERDRPLTKINSIKPQPDQAAAVAANIRDGSPRQAETPDRLYRSPQVNGSRDQSPGEMMAHHEPHQTPSILGSMTPTTPTPQYPQQEPEPRALTRTSSMQQLEQWVRTQRVRNQDDDTRSIMSYQTLPRNMPSHRAPPVMPHCGDPGYRTLPRNSMLRPDSICSMSPTIYDQTLGMGLGLGISPADKRRSMRDDTMWQLYEWQQRMGYTPSPRPTSSPPGPYGTLPSPKTMINLSEHQGDSHQSIPPSPSHGSLSMYGGYSPLRSSYNHSSTRSEVGLLVYQGDITIDRRHSRTSHLNKYAYPPDRRPMPAGIPVQTITAQSLQGKTMSPEEYREHSCMCRPQEVDIDAKLSRLWKQDKVVRTQEDKLQQLHREKHTLEMALLSASQEIEMSFENPATVHGVIQQNEVLQSGLLSTCRELFRVNTELERSWRKYEKMERDVSLAKNNLLEQLEALGSPQTGPPSQQHVHIQKELWRIQDVMEALSKNKAQRSSETQGYSGSTPISNKQKSEGPDYRLYKSEPELTTVAEVDETNGEDRSEQCDRDPSDTKGLSYPVGIIPPRTKSPIIPEASTICVTLRKGRRPDPHMERPRSAVDQLCGGPVEKESGRPRMSVEEQLERIRKHQQWALREKTKGLHIMNCRQRDEVMSSDILELEASLREQEVFREQETPAEEIARLKEASHTDHYNMDRELSVPEKVLIPERYVESDPEEALSPEQEAGKQKKVDRIKALIAKNSMQNVLSPPSGVLSPEEEATAQEQEKMINISYELAAEASKRSKLVAACPPPHRFLSPNLPHLHLLTHNHHPSSLMGPTSCVCNRSGISNCV